MRGPLIWSLAAVAIVATWGPSPVSAARAQAPTPTLDGKTIYHDNCQQCHGVIGQPTKTAQAKYEHIPSFKDSTFFAARSQDSILTILKKGKGKDMKSFAQKLTEAQMVAVAQYIRTLVKK